MYPNVPAFGGFWQFFPMFEAYRGTFLNTQSQMGDNLPAVDLGSGFTPAHLRGACLRPFRLLLHPHTLKI
eukprot:4729604-Amphidinium_carterae.1